MIRGLRITLASPAAVSVAACMALAGCSLAVDLDSLSAQRNQPDGPFVPPVDALPIVDASPAPSSAVDAAAPPDGAVSANPPDAPSAPDAGAVSLDASLTDGNVVEDKAVSQTEDGPNGIDSAPDAPPAPEDGRPADGLGQPPVSPDATAAVDGTGGSDGAPDAPPMCPRLPSHDATLYLLSGSSTTTGCGYARSSLSGHIAAVDPMTFAASGSCGACMRVETAAGAVVAQVVEQGPSTTAANPTSLSLNRAAVKVLLPDGSTFSEQGVAWKFVPCPLAQGTGMTFQFQDGSNTQYAALLIQRHRFRLASVEYRSNGSYRSLTRASYNYWVAANGMGGGPFTLRITDVHGHSVEQTGVPLKPGTVFEGLAQFPACSMSGDNSGPVD